MMRADPERAAAQRHARVARRIVIPPKRELSPPARREALT